ncbi:lethal, putative [Pediculus humanus corporis]|uniref:Lethal, putative n=1 Tax=Pediculus humanus subsp. corporis TaxID=121224 RepID=E0VM51_PEDHC|nr:lethal, putative [Pediculus humanus corporis]EEB14457.1 lethal, putative [Pediculus humanus corporis]
MGCEFVSFRFCSVACSKAYAEEKAQSVKKLLLKQEKKMKLKQQKSLLMQQRAKLEKLGLHEAKVTIEEKIKMLRMERELMKTNAGDSDGESGSGTSSNTDKLRSSSKGSFSWTRYLTLLKAKSAPYTLFKDPFPTARNNFKIGMKLEGIDPVHPSLFCVLTVAAVRGYRIKLHFDGYPDCHDFWVNANSSDIFHAGCCFVNNQERPIIPSGFRAGMKLEAVDKKNSSLVCVATIADVLDNRILVHFDSWDDIYDYWVDCTSPYIHPVGWCKENGHQLTPPNDYKHPSLFSWDFYLRETKSLPAPARAFKPRTTTDFRRGMKLECVDKRNPILIRVATVVDIVVQQIKIKFDGWPDQYAYWLDDDSPDIHPAGWCHKTGHPLEPPPSEEDIKNTSICPTPGCRGIGHVKGKHPVHHMILSCPYSSMNYLRDDHIPDRFCSKREYYEVKETSASKGTKPRPGIPRKNKCDGSILPVPKTDNRGRKRKLSSEKFKKEKKKKSYREPPPNLLTKKKSRVNNLMEENVDPGTRNDPVVWSKNRWDISETVASIGSNPLCWTPSQVAAFVENINSSSEKGKLFTEHQIDGEALLMLSQNDLVQILGFKLGPAIKLYKSIVLLRQKALEIKNEGVS